MKIYEGNILTCDKDNHVYKYLVEDQGVIQYVGDSLDKQYEQYNTIKLGNKALIPAFCDSHIHFASFATFYSGLNVMNAKNNKEILDMLKEFVKTCDDSLIICFGASPYSVEEQTLVSRKELDSVCPDKPVFLIKYDGHACIVNTVLLNKIKNKVKDLRGYHEESGEMNQDAFFVVSDYVTNSISIPKLLKNMQKAADFIASKGIGMFHSVSGVGFTLDLDVDMERFFARGLNNGLQMRVYFQTLDVNKAKKRKLTCIGGCFETALDGCFGSQDAAMLLPYENTDNYGVLYNDDKTIIDFCKKANREGMQIEIHAIGDDAFRQATLAIKEALDDYPRDNHRHTIIHACLPTKEGLEICRDYHICIAAQSAFIDWPQEPDSYLYELLGERSNQLNPFKTFIDHNLVVSLGSDGPCTTPSPIEWIHKVCNHSNKEQCVDIKDALKMATYNGYYTSFDEKQRGSLEVGKIADMVILSDNPYTCDTSCIKNIQVEKLLLNGEDYKNITINPILQVVKGMLSKG